MSRIAPRIGITVANVKDKPATYSLGSAYAQAVADAGGVPLMLAQLPELIDAYLETCDGLLLTGGADPLTEPYGEPTHPAANRLAPARQHFESALLAALDLRPETPVLGICLGCQMMALHAGGRLDQHMPETLGDAAARAHQGDRLHRVEPVDWPLGHARPGQVVSSDHQAIAEPGRLRVAAVAPDGVIEAVHDPARGFYLGVQWHPERTTGPDAPAGLTRGLFQALVLAAGEPAARAGRS